MIKSMTGYGRGEITLNERIFVIEIKSVNNRYLDINVKMPKIMNSFEDKIRKIISSKVFRGKIDVLINFKTFSKNDIKIYFNENLSDTYVNKIEEIISRYNIKKPDILKAILDFPDILTVENTVSNDNSKDEVWEGLESALLDALEQFLVMRAREGEALKEDILKKTTKIEEVVTNIKEKAPIAIEEHREKLQKRVLEVLGDNNIDEQRIFTEIVLLADKNCIDEEIIRMISHVSQLRTILCEDGTTGRKLDFLIQEMIREVNTIGSKSNNIEITNFVLELKSEIEKIREQIQNLE